MNIMIIIIKMIIKITGHISDFLLIRSGPGCNRGAWLLQQVSQQCLQGDRDRDNGEDYADEDDDKDEYDDHTLGCPDLSPCTSSS